MKTKNMDPHFGGCPQCEGYTGVLSIGRDQWFYCDDCKTKWWIGSNLFSSWREMTAQEFEGNRKYLQDYIEVEPVLPERQAHNDTSSLH